MLVIEVWRAPEQPSIARLQPGHLASLPPPAAARLRLIQGLGEVRLAPGAVLPGQLPPGVERLTWVQEGALVVSDGRGCTEVVRAGELEHLVPGRTLRVRAVNASRTHVARLIELRLLTAPELHPEPRHEHRRFSAAQRRGGLCLVASPEGREGSLRVHLAAQVFSGVLDPGQHLAHPLERSTAAVLHVMRGLVSLADQRLQTGDGAALTAEHALSLVSLAVTELLLVVLPSI